MSYNFSSGNFSSSSLGGFLRPSISTYNSVYPSNVIIPPKTYQLGFSGYGGQQESFCKPINSQASCTGTRSFQTSFVRPNNFISSSPCQTNFIGSLGYGNIGFGSFDRRNTSYQYLGYGSSFYRPAYSSTRSFQ
ncbi:PREDICTED: keratin-associated protein 15-1-like [Chinchilla lanigera]|uniref:keratin-associated protein 15-1-like n=1 Tax=Chinchilla lanigera TaxID=34839 RepID=UPI00038EB700|nr:PREDICTED: keratin-associated protein 15-1-like [Chinchilla lanigera]